MAQLVKNSPAMKETWVRSLGWEDPLEKGKVFWPGEFSPWGGKESDTFDVENGSERAHFVCCRWEWLKAQSLSWARLAMFKLKTEIPDIQACFVLVIKRKLYFKTI